MLFHDGEMHGITRRQPSMTEYNLFRALGHCPIDSQHLIDNPQQGIEGWLNGFAVVNGYVAVQNLLQDLSIRNQTLAVADQRFQQLLRVALVTMRSSHQIHGDIGVDEDHECSTVP